MFADVVLPNNNEEELLKAAENLGFNKLIFLYSDKKQKPSLPKPTKIKVFSGIIIDNPNDAGMMKAKFDYVFAPAQRNFFENPKIDFFVDAESDDAPDLLYQKRAGLDDASCSLAKEHEATILFDVSQENKNVLGRFLQNSMLCRKYRLKSLVATLAKTPIEMRSAKDLAAFSRAIRLV